MRSPQAQRLLGHVPGAPTGRDPEFRPEHFADNVGRDVRSAVTEAIGTVASMYGESAEVQEALRDLAQRLGLDR